MEEDVGGAGGFRKSGELGEELKWKVEKGRGGGEEVRRVIRAEKVLKSEKARVH